MSYSLQQARLLDSPKVPSLLQKLDELHCVPQSWNSPNQWEILFPHLLSRPPYRVEKGISKPSRPLRVGAFFSGGPAAGGHNVLAGLFDGLHQIHSSSELFGFLGGPGGFLEGKSQLLSRSEIDSVRNQGGFDLLGSDRTKIETSEQFRAALQAVQMLKLDALLVIGGDDSNTNAAFLAEYFLAQRQSTCVLGVPKTIDGDLRSSEIEISFGFDSACRTYAELIGNVARDARSARKYYHVIKLMGRSASHIVLECALQTQPNLALIGEERKPLPLLVREMADLIVQRRERGKEYGVILVPEGLLEFVPELEAALGSTMTKDPHGNLPVSQMETEKCLIALVKKELEKRSIGSLPHFQDHFFGYEGRSCFPTPFDANYAYALGITASLGARDGLTGVIASLSSLQKTASFWKPQFTPLLSMMVQEKRKGILKAVIGKTLVDLKGSPFLKWKGIEKSCQLEDRYLYPGPIQFFGPDELTHFPPLTLGIK